MSADRNLLAGILALQMDFVSGEQLLASMNAWALTKQTPLLDVLHQRGVLTEEDVDAVSRLVERHIARHGGDAAKSLAAVNLDPALAERLASTDDADVRVGMSTVGTMSRQPTPPVASLPPLVQSPGPGMTRYRRLREHAKGGLGEVSVALDEELKREVALKEIQAQYADYPEMRARFIREAEITGQLDHPGVVPVYGLGLNDEGRPYYAMRFIGGDSMEAAIRRYQDGGGVSDLRALLNRFVAVCNAVAFAHSRGIIHRDLKPANIMLGEYGETLVVDWGLARRVTEKEEETRIGRPLALSETDGGTIEGQAIGTPTFMPPEQARGRLEETGPHSDIFSLGATLYAILTGKPPYCGPTPLSEALACESKPARKVKSDVSAALDAICRKAMAKQPGERYAAARELAADVDRWLADEPVSAYRDPLSVRLMRWGRRHRTLVSSLAALFLTLTVALSVGLYLVNAERANTRKALEDKEIETAKVVEAENQRRVELGRTHAAVARLSAQRGQWQEALDHYRQALTFEPEDEIALRLGMLDCYLARYEYRLFREELAGLVARTDLGKHRGEVRLHEAIGLLFSARKDAQPIPLVQEAIKLGLPPADEAFARAFISPSVPEATEHLQNAIRLDPHHRQANDWLPGMYFLLGRISEMRESVAKLQMIAPNSFTTLMWHAELLALDNNLDGAYRECEKLRPSLGNEGVQLARLTMRLLHTFVHTEVWDLEKKRLALLADILAAAPLVSRLSQEKNGDVERWGDLSLFRIPCLQVISDHPLFKGSGSIAEILALTQSKSLSKLLTRVIVAMPNGSFFYAQGCSLRAEGRSAEAEAVFTRALTTPSPVPIYRAAMYELIVLESLRLDKTPPAGQAKLKKQIRTHLYDLAGRGSYPPKMCNYLAHIAQQIDEPALALVFSEAAVRQSPGDADFQYRRFGVELALGAFTRAIGTLNQQLIKKPNNDALLNNRSVVEYRQGQMRSALATTFAVLKSNPKHKFALGNQDAIATRLRLLSIWSPILLEKLRLRKALILVHQGKHAEAVKALVGEKAEGDALIASACVFALAASAVGGDAKLTVEERSKRAEEHAVESIKLLRKGIDAGYFKEPLRVDFLNTEHDLDGLRKRDDFKKLMETIKKPG